MNENEMRPDELDKLWREMTKVNAELEVKVAEFDRIAEEYEVKLAELRELARRIAAAGS